MVALRGPLGGGKSELARALIRARAGAAIEVPSPSFTLVQDYALGGLMIRHIDLYRLERAGRARELGLAARNPDEAWLIEWPERAGDVAAADRPTSPRAGRRPRTRGSRVCSAGPRWRTARRCCR